MSERWFLWAWIIVAILGPGGVLVWMGKTIKAMRGTVDAQEKTIRAQADRIDSMETLVKTTETVLKFTDVEVMLKRMKAYKEINELELETWKTQTDAERKKLTAELEEERKKVVAGSEELDAAMFHLTDTETGLFDLATKTMPYISKNKRDELISSLELGRAWSAPTAHAPLPPQHCGYRA